MANPYNLSEEEFVLEEHSWRCLFDDDLELLSGELVASLVEWDPSEIDRVLNSVALLVLRSTEPSTAAHKQIRDLLQQYDAEEWFEMGHYARMALDTAMVWERG